MVAQIESKAIIYPERDGNPMSDNTVQFRWITTIEYNLEWLFRDNRDVFVAGDLLWYPVQQEEKIRQAPDIMVVFGREKGDRGSYQQWKEENIPPQVVWEILSPGNTLSEMTRKQVFYNKHKVEEYYIYDPQKNDLSGWYRSENNLEVIEEMHNWVSPRLGISFKLGEELSLFHPDGQPFSTYTQERQKAETERQKAEKLAQKLRELGIDPDEISSGT